MLSRTTFYLICIIGKANGHLTLSVSIKRQSHLSLVLSIGIVKLRPVDVVA